MDRHEGDLDTLSKRIDKLQADLEVIIAFTNNNIVNLARQHVGEAKRPLSNWSKAPALDPAFREKCKNFVERYEKAFLGYGVAGPDSATPDRRGLSIPSGSVSGSFFRSINATSSAVRISKLCAISTECLPIFNPDLGSHYRQTIEEWYLARENEQARIDMDS